MIRAVLDTTVLASGFVEFASSQRAPARLLRLWRDQRFELVVCDDIVIELLRTLGIPYFRQRVTTDQVRAAERLLQDEATSTPVSVAVSGVAPHAEDDLILAAALTAGADYLVTGDKRFQEIGSYGGVTILSPRAFLDLLESSGDS